MKLKKTMIISMIIAFILASVSIPAAMACQKVNINKASVQELASSLNRVGEKYAQRIVEYRQKTPFKKVEDIMNVKGIGKSIFENNKDCISISDK